MKRAPLTLVAALAFGLVLGCGSFAEAGPGGGLASFTLLPVPASPFVSLRIVLRCGSIDDPAGKEGLAHLTAQVVSAGGSGDLSRQMVLTRLYPMAARFYAQVDREVMSFVCLVHREKLAEFYELVAGLLFRPRFDPADFARERDNAINHLRGNLRGTDDESLGKEVLDQEIHRGHPYGHCIVGTVDGLESISLEDVRAFWDRALVSDRVVIGVGGGYPPEFLDRLREDFGRLPAGGAGPKPLPDRAPIEDIQVTLVSKPCEATAISLGFPIAVTRSDPDFYALLVANAFFGDHRTFVGRLQKSMRVARGLNYGNYSYIEHFIQGAGRFAAPGIPRRAQEFTIWIRPVKPEHAQFALRQAIRELRRLIEKGMTEAEVREYKQYVLYNSPLWIQTLERRLGYLLDSRFYGIEDHLGEIARRVPGLRAEEVNAAIRRHLQGKNLQVVLVTDRAEALKRALLDNTSSPITYDQVVVPAGQRDEDREIMDYPLKINPARIRVVPASSLFEAAGP